ncbi:cytochrome P450 [Xylariomycetidae sp. FL0641]|nr:cytochrome P450 [Xylariomycetidae sp. FL0641]
MLVDVFKSITSSDAVFIYLPVLFILWNIFNTAKIYYHRPTDIELEGFGLFWGKWLSSWDYVLRGSQNIRNLYQRSTRRPFAIPALNEYLILISNPRHVVEVARAPESVLSFHAAMKDRLKHKITMMGFEHNHVDPDEYVTMQVVKMHLRKNLRILNPIIQRALSDGFRSFLQGPIQNKGSVTVNVFDLAKVIVGRVNNQIFFGEVLSKNEEFAQAALRYPWDGSMTAELLRYLPSSIAPFVGHTIMYLTGSMEIVRKHVTDLVYQRLEAGAEKTEQNIDVTQFVMDTSRTPEQRDPVRMVGLIAGLLFAVSLAVPMALYWAILNLCIHREFIPLLRAEIETLEQQGRQDQLKAYRLLDSFLRETARLSPPDALTAQRKVLQPFTFSDGAHIPAGNLVAVPVHAVLRDAEYYPAPDTFNPYRFYSPEAGDADRAVHAFTDVNMQYPYWGAPTKSCPGRWYASDVLKQILIYFIQTYDFELLLPANCAPLRLTTALAPRMGVKMVIKPRA